jgi:ATP synthase protein I
MKLLPKVRTDVRVNTEDSLGHGMDAVIVLVLFLGAGFGIDRLAGTTPIFMIALTVLGAIGLFAKFYYSYEQRMNQHDAERLAKLQGPSAAASSDEAA